jgi:hypothetical protein
MILRRVLAAALLAAFALGLLSQPAPSYAKCDPDTPTAACVDINVGGGGGAH